MVVKPFQNYFNRFWWFWIAFMLGNVSWWYLQKYLCCIFLCRSYVYFTSNNFPLLSAKYTVFWQKWLMGLVGNWCKIQLLTSGIVDAEWPFFLETCFSLQMGPAYPSAERFWCKVLLCCSVLHLCGDHHPYYRAEPLHPTREVSSVSLMQSLHRKNPGPQEICSVPTELNNKKLILPATSTKLTTFLNWSTFIFAQNGHYSDLYKVWEMQCFSR